MHYFRRPLDLQLTQHNDLDEFLESLDSLRQAAKDDLERAERRQSNRSHPILYFYCSCVGDGVAKNKISRCVSYEVGWLRF